MAYEKQTWVDGQSRLSAERMNHIEDGIVNVSSSVDNAVTINTDQTVTGKKEFTHADGIGTNAVHNISGNAMLRYKSTEDKIVIGSSTKPLTLMGSGDRPTYSKDGSDFSGNALAFKSEVDTQENNWDLLWANLGVGRWRSQMFSAWINGNVISDPLLKNYTNCSYCFANVTYYTANEIWGNEPQKKNIEFDSDTYASCSRMNGMFKFFKLGGGTLTVDLRNGYSFEQAFYGCDASKIVFKNPTELKPFAASQVFWACKNLVEIGEFDASRCKFLGNLCSSSVLKRIHIKHFITSFDIHYSTAFEESDLVEIISNLDTVSNGAVLTMGTTNLNKLTTDEISVATGKGWTLA